MDVGQDDDAGTDSKDTVKPSAPDVEAGETDLDTSGLDEQAEGLSPPIACEMDVRIDGLESSTQDHMDPGHSNIPSPHLEKRNTIQQTTYGSRAIAERRYACPKCARTFTRPQNLNYHLLVHAQNRPFPCQSCHLSFCASAT
ncbi:hypothetical protein DFS34DRAFT_469261 [Phlyctochytrium arcticum]|nr:hypothetical protein DFS34DRAFT_469261 [Phlyctochytrium arcticum]